MPTHLEVQVEVDPTQLVQKLGTLSKDKRELPKHYVTITLNAQSGIVR